MAVARASRLGRMIGWGLPLAAEAAAMGRSMAIAWATGPEELGQAMMLALTFRLTEMLSDVGVERMLAQSVDGDSAGFLARLHGAALLRAVVMAAVLAALAWPMAALFADGPTPAAYAALAVVALVRGFQNLAHRQAERRMAFGQTAAVEGAGTVAGLVAAVVAAMALGDHRAMLVAFLAQGVAAVVVSHVVAGQRYRVAFDRGFLGDLVRFGWPLAVNALLLFAVFQADRLIVAGWMGWAEVAIYGVALQLAMLPAQIAGRAAAVLLTPALRMARDAGTLEQAADAALRTYLAGGVIFALGYALVAPGAIAVLYGAAMRPDLMVVAGLGIAAGARILRTPLSQVAVIAGRTGDPARANLWRAAALVPATVAAAAGMPLAAIAGAAALGEVAATLRAIHLYRGQVAAIPSLA
jgi:O-antigen/teichoic acid export membrane protein